MNFKIFYFATFICVNIKKYTYIIIMISRLKELLDNLLLDNDSIFEINNEKTFIERLQITKIFELEHPNKIPVILQQSNKNIVRLNKKYFFLSIDKNYTIDNIKKKLKDNAIHNYTHLKINKNNDNISKEEYYDINFYIYGKFIYNDVTLENLYSLYKDSDGLLKIIFREPIAEQLIFDNPDYLPIIINIDKKKENICKLFDPCTYIINSNLSTINLFDIIKNECENKKDDVIMWLAIINKQTYKYQSISYDYLNICDIYNEHKDDDGFLRIYFLYDIK
jgi:hypothetical protein